MYIQLTDRCNMRCEHCCMESHPKRKRFMSDSVFEACIDLALQYDMYYITLGGGEPTLHTNIFKYIKTLKKLYWHNELSIQPFMVTNGKNYARALKIYKETQPDEGYGQYSLLYNLYPDEYAEFFDEPGIRIELSTDYYHKAIAFRILELYRRSERRRDPGAGTRDVTTSYSGVMGIGRARKNGIADFKPNDCACETLFIDPDGDVYSCGCRTHKLGDIFDTSFMDWYNEKYAHTGGREPVLES